MSLSSELVLESKLETTFFPNYTQHTYYKRGTSGEKRRIQVRERWKRQKRLGQGAYGSVWLETCSRPAKQDGPKVRAVKEIPIDLRTRSAIDCHRELEAVMKFSQARVRPSPTFTNGTKTCLHSVLMFAQLPLQYVSSFVHSFGWFESPDATFIAMEYVENGDLQTYLNDPVPEEEVKMIAYQLADGLNHMHQNGFAHRDLKPGVRIVLINIHNMN
ncbi:calcium/calmodulin-dependent protein kinase type 1B [Colletotrichum higginsianum]|nr:calcium/calmodulin-dependent protein kinase type 1B [Colletotrichum higginsianum]